MKLTDEQIRELCANITRGPWKAVLGEGDCEKNGDCPKGLTYCNDDCQKCDYWCLYQGAWLEGIDWVEYGDLSYFTDNDALFIAAARELVPQLLERAQRAEQVISSIVNLANEGKSVWFAEDWGGNTLTAQVNDAHTHVGAPEGSLDNLIKDLHALFVGGKGLNWVRHGSQEKEG